MTAETVTVELKQRNFRFSGGIPARVTCLHCGWTRAPGWQDAQRVFDLSSDHECAGVESHWHMVARTARERDAETRRRLRTAS